MKEIVTLQLGNVSNYVATHYWNAQESYFTYLGQDESLIEHNIHWRAGLGADGTETFLPRTVLYDLKGGFGSMRKINALYDAGDEADQAAIWAGPRSSHKAPPIIPNSYQQSLDAGTVPAKLTASTVRYWSDFSRVYYHPKSLVQLYDYELSSTVMPFERFDMGTELFASLDKEHDIVDRDWRPFVEECDLLQGIQIFSTIDDAWGGFASSYLEALRDEYPKSPMWTWALQSPILSTPRDQRQRRLVNTAQSLSRLHDHASTTIPLSVPEDLMSSNVSLDRTSPWHTSGYLAAGVETALLPSRLRAKNGPAASSLAEMAEALNTTGDRHIANMHLSIEPQDAQANDIEITRVDTLGSSNLSLLGRLPVSRRERSNVKLFGHISSARGMEESSGGESDAKSETKRSRLGEAITRRFTTPLRFPLLDSFPPIFTRSPGTDSVAVRAILSTDSTIAARMDTLVGQVVRSVPVSDREALSNSLAEIGEAYREDWWSDDDDGDDDV